MPISLLSQSLLAAAKNVTATRIGGLASKPIFWNKHEAQRPPIQHKRQYNPEIQRLIRGNHEYREQVFNKGGENVISKKLAQEGQNPKTLLITCCDSRLDPNKILRCSLGELFTARNIGNLIPPYNQDNPDSTHVAIEMALNKLAIQNIIILGHSDCGGVRELLTPTMGAKSLMSHWLSTALSAKEKVLVEHKDQSTMSKAQMAEEQSLLLSLENLKKFPGIQKRVQEGSLVLHAWRYQLDSAKIQSYQGDAGKFVDLDSEQSVCDIDVKAEEIKYRKA
jgi:carbonic anhydrase